MKKNNFGIGVNKNYLSVCLATALLGYSLGAVSAADTPRQGGTIILATLKEPKCLDPTVGGDVPQDIIAHMFTDSLISQNEDGSYHPWLVKSWDVTDSGKTYTLHLRDDVKFTDGTKFNAVAVKANFAHWLDPNTGSANIAPQLTDLVSVTATDEYTLTVKLKKANSFFLTTLANPSAGMQSPKAFSRGNTVNCESPVGTGPFIVDKWNRGNEVIFKRNPNYNSSPPQALHTGPAYADKVIWQTITDPATRLNALLSGEVGVLNGLPPEGYLSAKATPDIAIIADFQPGVPWQIDLNIKRAPFNDLRVRQAFRYSLDAPAALRSIFFGAYKPAGGRCHRIHRITTVRLSMRIHTISVKLISF